MIKRCRDCGNEFVTEHHQKKLCDNCAALHAMITQQKSGKKAKMKRANAVKICALCGKEYSGRKSKYCSSECKHKALRKAEKPTKIRNCLHCGKEMVLPLNSRQKYCSEFCRDEAQRENAEKWFAPKSQDRPFTEETAYLIKLWHEKGDSPEKIALAMDRPLDVVKAVLYNGRTLKEERNLKQNKSPLQSGNSSKGRK